MDGNFLPEYNQLTNILWFNSRTGSYRVMYVGYDFLREDFVRPYCVSRLETVNHVNNEIMTGKYDGCAFFTCFCNGAGYVVRYDPFSPVAIVGAKRYPTVEVMSIGNQLDFVRSIFD